LPDSDGHFSSEEQRAVAPSSQVEYFEARRIFQPSDFIRNEEIRWDRFWKLEARATIR
jgi:hypothetical protein